MSYYIVEQCGRPHASPAKPGGPYKQGRRNRHCRMSDAVTAYDNRMSRLLFYINILLLYYVRLYTTRRNYVHYTIILLK